MAAEDWAVFSAKKSEERAALGWHGNTEVVALAPPLAGAPVSGVRNGDVSPARSLAGTEMIGASRIASGSRPVLRRNDLLHRSSTKRGQGSPTSGTTYRAAPHHPVAHPRPGTQALMAPCEWCEKKSDQLSPIRDWEEHGSFAPREIWCAHSASRNTAKALRSRRRSGRPTWSPATPLHHDDRHHPDLNAEDGGWGTTERPKVCPPRYLPSFCVPLSRCTHQAGEHVKHGFSLHPWVRPPPLTAMLPWGPASPEAPHGTCCRSVSSPPRRLGERSDARFG